LDACSLPECESLVLIPLRFADVNLGLLHVSDPQPRALSVSMVESLERLSLEISAVIHRVRIEEALRAARDELETRVSERTAELLKSNRALQNEIEERVRLEREVLQAGVREQQRIGQELHDGLGQELTGLSYLAQNLRLTLQARGAAESDMAAELARGIPLALGQIQKIVRGLVPLEIGAADLEIALDVLTSNVAKLTGITCRFDSDCCDLINDDDVAIQIYRIAQEAITNAVKHARATTVDVTLEKHGDRIRLEVCDDGAGIQANAEKGAGCGLRSMSYRARAIGGEFDVRQKSCGGTIVVCSIPRTASGAAVAESSDHES
jgi:signal transduction histidine kinase